MQKKPKLAIIGGSGFEQLFSAQNPISIETPYGVVSTISIENINNHHVAFLSRHGKAHLIAPHKINYRANIWALHKLGVERIISLNAVGAIDLAFRPEDIVVPHDFVDFTKILQTTFYDEEPVTHIDMSIPYCPELRQILIEKLKISNLRIWEKAVFVCTNGPRFETPAEIEMFKRLGCSIIGMTGIPEAILSRELEICYATICYVSNMAAGLQPKILPSDTLKNAKLISPKIGQALIDAIAALPMTRQCPCSSALKDARFQ